MLTGRQDMFLPLAGIPDPREKLHRAWHRISPVEHALRVEVRRAHAVVVLGEARRPLGHKDRILGRERAADVRIATEVLALEFVGVPRRTAVFERIGGEVAEQPLLFQPQGKVRPRPGPSGGGS